MHIPLSTERSSSDSDVVVPDVEAFAGAGASSFDDDPSSSSNVGSRVRFLTTRDGAAEQVSDVAMVGHWPERDCSSGTDAFALALARF